MTTNEKTYQNIQDWYNDQKKEVKYACGVAITVAFFFFCSSCESMVDSGFFGFISGIITCAGIGLLVALVFLLIYWIAAAHWPQKAEKVLDELTRDPEEDELD